MNAHAQNVLDQKLFRAHPYCVMQAATAIMVDAILEAMKASLEHSLQNKNDVVYVMASEEVLRRLDQCSRCEAGCVSRCEECTKKSLA